jgi:hypothetical protein
MAVRSRLWRLRKFAHDRAAALEPSSICAAGFLDKHPGGREMLLLAAGRECTDLFASYHALVKDQAKLPKYLAGMEIGALAGAAGGLMRARVVAMKRRPLRRRSLHAGALKLLLRFSGAHAGGAGVFTGPTEFPVFSPDSRGFYETLRKRVDEYFSRTGYDPKSPWGGAEGMGRNAVGWALSAQAPRAFSTGECCGTRYLHRVQPSFAPFFRRPADAAHLCAFRPVVHGGQRRAVGGRRHAPAGAGGAAVWLVPGESTAEMLLERMA